MRLHDSVKYSIAEAPAAATTDNTAFVSTILDTANFAINEFVMLLGSIADADATFVVLMEEGDASNLSDASAVADEQLIGTEALATPLFSDDNSTKKLGYRGIKRYIRVTITPSANTGDIYLAALWAQAGARTAPQA